MFLEKDNKNKSIYATSPPNSSYTVYMEPNSENEVITRSQTCEEIISNVYQESNATESQAASLESKLNDPKQYKCAIGSLLYAIHLSLILEEFKAGNRVRNTQLVDIIHKLTINLKSICEIFNNTSLFQKYTNQQLKRFRSKLDRIENFYSYCLSANDTDEHYKNLFSNILKVKSTPKRSRSAYQLNNLETGTDKPFYDYNCKSMPVFKYFYLKYFIADFCEQNPIRDLIPEFLSSILNICITITLDYEKEITIGRKDENIPNIRIYVYRAHENSLQYYVSNEHWLDEEAMYNAEDFVIKSWADYNQLNRIEFFKSQYCNYFKEVLDYFTESEQIILKKTKDLL